MLFVYLFAILLSFLWTFKSKASFNIPRTNKFLNDRRRVFIFLGLLLLSTTRSIKFPDCEEYIRIFTKDDLFDTRYEIGFKYCVNLLRLITNEPRVFFFIFGLIGISMKMKAIYKYSPEYMTSILIYLSVFFVILDMIQLRNSLSISLFVLAVVARSRDKWKEFVIYGLGAMLFHYSALVLIFFMVCSSRKRIELYKWIIPAAYVIHFFGNIVVTIDVSNLGLLSQAFIGNTYDNDLLKPVNVFNIVQIMRITFFYIIFFNINEVSNRYSYAYLMLKVYALGIAMLPMLSFYPSISGRISSYLCSIEILLLPSLFYINNHKQLYRYILYAYCMGSLLIFLLSDDNRF